MPAEHLSTALFRETRGTGFFRVLAGRNAAFYVDVLDGLERETSDRADGMAREEAIALIVETLEAHPGFEFDPDAAEAEAASQASYPGSRPTHSRLLVEMPLAGGTTPPRLAKEDSFRRPRRDAHHRAEENSVAGCGGVYRQTHRRLRPARQ